MAVGANEIRFRIYKIINMETINILCATDKNFVPYCRVMLTSLFENNKDEHISVYLLVDDTVLEKDRSKYLELAKQYVQTIHIISVDSSTFEKYPVYNSQWTNSIYYRLLAAELLPKSINKIIYLDADIIVTRSIREMWEIDVEKYALGAVHDIWAPNQQVYNRLGLKNDKQYFNSGSMILNLKYWRENELSRKYMQYIQENFEKLWFNDQDTLNGVLFNKKLMLPVTYNFQVLFLKNSIFNEMTDEQKKNILETKNPLIMHYSASTKPWMIMYYKMPFLELWRKYRDLSMWRNTRNLFPKTKVLNWLIKRYVLWPLNIYFKQEYIRIK